jgi:hypothetical protein
MQRKKPYSGAQKKKQLQEKRAKQRGEEVDHSSMTLSPIMNFN